MAVRTEQENWNYLDTVMIDALLQVKMEIEKYGSDNNTVFKTSSTFPISLSRIVYAIEGIGSRKSDQVKSYLIEKFSDNKTFQTYEFLRTDLPFVHDRDYIVEHEWKTVGNEPNEVVELTTHSIEKEDYPVVDGVIRGDIKKFDFQLESIGPDRTNVSLVVHVDNKGTIPTVISNRLQKNWAERTLREIYYRAKSGGDLSTIVENLPEKI